MLRWFAVLPCKCVYFQPISWFRAKFVILFDSLKVSTDLQITNFLAVNTVRATGDYVLRSDFLLFCLAHHRHNKIRPLRLTTVQLRLCTYYFKSEVPYALSALKIVSLIT